MTIREICKKYGLSQTALAKRFGIPLRTVQDWHAERRQPPEYVVSMMVEVLERDRQENSTDAVVSTGDFIRALSDEDLAKVLVEYLEDWDEYYGGGRLHESFKEAWKAEVESLKEPVDEMRFRYFLDHALEFRPF